MKRRASDPALAARIESLEAAIAGLAAAADGHAAWLSDLQSGIGDVAGVIAVLQSDRDRATEWLGTLERWMNSSVRLLAGLGGQPLPDADASASASLDLSAAMLHRLDVWIVMRWIKDAAVVEEDALVSVITATRGERPEMLQRAVASVLAQTYAKLDLIVVDDSDRGDVQQSLAGLHDARARVIHAPPRRAGDRGAGVALNTGLAAVRGDLVAVLDDDNLMDSEWLRSLVWAFATQPQADCLYGARICEDPNTKHGIPSGAMPSLDFDPYDRRRHERANYIDQNTLAWRAPLCEIRYDEELFGSIDWERELRLFARATPLALPAVACYYRTLHRGRISDRSDVFENVRKVRLRAHATRPLRVHVHTEMYPVISETYIGEDISSLAHCGAEVTVSALQEAVSRAVDAEPCRLDYDAAIHDAQPDVVLMHWATHAEHELPTIERHEVPFACRVHTFDVDRDLVARLLVHPLCVGVFAHPHHLALLPAGVQPLIPVVGPWTSIPDSPAVRDLVLSVSAGLPKKRFPLLIEAMAQFPEHERLIIVARTNGVLELPGEVEELASAQSPPVPVKVNAQRDETLAAMARASIFVYTLSDDAVMGFPMSIVEAMLCGAIVIAPDRPEAHEIVGPHLRTYRTADDIARHVGAVMAGGSDVEAARADLRQRAQRHRAPEEIRRLHDGLRSAVAARLQASI